MTSRPRCRLLSSQVCGSDPRVRARRLSCAPTVSPPATVTAFAVRVLQSNPQPLLYKVESLFGEICRGIRDRCTPVRRARPRSRPASGLPPPPPRPPPRPRAHQASCPCPRAPLQPLVPPVLAFLAGHASLCLRLSRRRAAPRCVSRTPRLPCCSNPCETRTPSRWILHAPAPSSLIRRRCSAGHTVCCSNRRLSSTGAQPAPSGPQTSAITRSRCRRCRRHRGTPG